MSCFISLIALMLLYYINAIDFSCPENQTLNTLNFTCVPCTGNKEMVNGICQCKERYIIEGDDCRQCSDNTYPNSDKTRCLECLDGDGKCICKADEILTEITPVGNYTKVYCAPLCPLYSTFENGTCNCNSTSVLVDGRCVAQAEIVADQNYQNIEYRFSVTTNQEDRGAALTNQGSDIMTVLYPSALTGCNNQIKKYCQVLANLCVLAMYSATMPQCSYFLNSSRENDVLPWIYYDESINAETYIYNESKVPFNVSLDKDDDVNQFDLNFYADSWDIEGNYYGRQKLKDDLILCSDNYNDTQDYVSFGSTIIKECFINITRFLSRKEYKMKFYELYLFKKDSGEYIDVPIYIPNIHYGTVGPYQARENFADIMSQWKLVRRFYIVDNLSGIRLNYTNTLVNATTISYPREIRLVVQIQNKNKVSEIFLPYLNITYFALPLSEGVSPLVKVKFYSEYTMNLDNFMKGAKIIFGIITALAFIVVIGRMYVWTKLNPSVLSPDNYYLWFLITFIFKVFKYWGLFLFLYTWGVSIYWYIFFKLQYRPYILLPPPVQEHYRPYYRMFNCWWGLGAMMYNLYMLYRIWQQCNFDIFFVDWEHDKDILVNNMNDIRSEKYRGAWRGLHIANQFNELQKKRTMSIEFCFVWLIMLWYYQETHWSTYAESVPTVSYVEGSPENYILRHCIATFVLFIAGISQYIVVRLVQLWIPLKKTEFLDLCSVSNVSVFILDQSLHGYYIHGQSPLGRSDTNLDELLRFLEEEGKGKIRGRGVTDDQNDDLQSYEIFLSYNMRTIYDGLYYIQTRAILQQADDTDKLHNQSRLPNPVKYIPNSLNIQSIYLLNSFMNTQLKNKIEGIASQSKIFIREKTNCERFLDFPPSIELTSENAKEMVFYKDPNESFDDVLFSGMELEWLVMVIYWFQMWAISLERYHRSFPLAIFLTFICEIILYKIRIFFGERNIAKKAVIDNRFFS